MTELRIGCSGWSYDHWRGTFYPDEIRAKDRLAYYASRFDTAEVNGSFYRLPAENTVKAWRKAVPDGFLFAWKASRFITHNKKLKDCEDSVALVFGRMDHLGDAFGPALFQLPPMLHKDCDRLAGFLKLLPKHRRHVVEFRHPSWYEREVFDILGDHDVALCISDHHDAPSPWEITAGHVYVRGHGPQGSYSGRYSRQTLESWAGRITSLREGGRDVFCYFDNDAKTAAPTDADVLIALTKDG